MKSRLLVFSACVLLQASASAESYSIQTDFIPHSFLEAGAQGGTGDLGLGVAAMPTASLVILADTGPTPDFTKGEFEDQGSEFGINISLGLLPRLDVIAGGLETDRPDWGGKFQFLGEPGYPKSGKLAAAVAYFAHKDSDSDSKEKSPIFGQPEGRIWGLEQTSRTKHLLLSYGLSDWWQLTADVFHSELKMAGSLRKYDLAVPSDVTYAFSGTGELQGLAIGFTYRVSNDCFFSLEGNAMKAKFTNAADKTVSALGAAGSCRWDFWNSTKSAQ